MQDAMHLPARAAALAALALALLAASAAAQDPAANHQPSPATQRCAGQTGVPSACLAAVTADIDAARTAEGVGPITLPTIFTRLTPEQQLLALADLERVDRGLSPAPGLSPQLNADARRGADAHDDPAGPDGYGWGSNWSSADSALFNDFAWMYDDGPGSFNAACPPGGGSGCWGHRHNILGAYADPVGMGAAAERGSQTQLFVSGYQPAQPGGSDAATEPLWSTIARTLPVGAPSGPVTLAHGTTGATLPVWASGEAMNVQAAVGAPWSVAPASCTLAAGHACQLTLTAPGGAAPSAATLRLTGPNGFQDVALSRTVPQAVTAITSRRTLRRGRRLVVTGAVRPATAGQHVHLQLRRGGTWRLVAIARTDGRGRYRLRTVPHTPGRRRYRAAKTASGGYEASATPALAIRVTR
jgi:hypothetical protein